MIRVRSATAADRSRIHEVRHGTIENRLTRPELVTDAEVDWYIENAVVLVSEDHSAVQGFLFANHQTAYVWALFVIEGAQGRGHGSALLDAGLNRLREAGHRQATLTTGPDTKAAGSYRSRGWQAMGLNLSGEMVFSDRVGAALTARDSANTKPLYVSYKDRRASVSLSYTSGAMLRPRSSSRWADVGRRFSDLWRRLLRRVGGLHISLRQAVSADHDA